MPGVLLSMGSQGVEHDLRNKQQQGRETQGRGWNTVKDSQSSVVNKLSITHVGRAIFMCLLWHSA